MNLFYGALLLFLHFVQILSECLITAPSNKCFYCKEKFFTSETVTPFDVSSCKPKSTTNLKREILVIAGNDVQPSDWQATKYLSLDEALLKESIESSKSESCELNFFLTKGIHYLYRKSFGNKESLLFRRSHCTIKFSPLLCSKKPILDKCYDPSKDVRPIIQMRSRWSFIFVSSLVSIDNLIFDGSDLHYPTETNLENDATCFNNKNVCCPQAEISKTAAENVNCGLKDSKLQASYPTSFCLFNIEGFPDTSPVSAYKIPQLKLINTQFRNFHLISKETGGFSCLIRLSMLPGSLDLHQFQVSHSLIPNHLITAEKDSSLVDPSFYTPQTKSLISSIPSTKYSSSSISTSALNNLNQNQNPSQNFGLKISFFNFMSIPAESQIQSFLSLNNYKGISHISSISVENSVLPGTKCTFLQIFSAAILVKNLKFSNCTNVRLFQIEASKVSVDNSSFLNVKANEKQHFVHLVKESTIDMKGFRFENVEFFPSFLTFKGEGSILGFSKGNFTGCKNLGIGFNGKNLSINRLEISKSDFQGNLIDATKFVDLKIENVHFEELVSFNKGNQVHLSSVYSIPSECFVKNYTVKATEGKGLMGIDKITLVHISGFTLNGLTKTDFLWSGSSTFKNLIVNGLTINKCRLKEAFSMDENSPHVMNFTNFKINELTMTNWTLFFYSNAVARFHNLDFKGLVMEYPKSSYFFVTLQNSINYFTNFSCIECGYLQENASILANQAEMSLIAGWLTLESHYSNLTVINTGKKLNFNGAILVHITVKKIISIANVTFRNFYKHPTDNFVYRALTLSHPESVEISNATFENMKCPYTKEWSTKFQYINGIIFVYESFSFAYAFSSKKLFMRNITLTNCECLQSGGGISVLNYHSINISLVTMKNTKTQGRGGQIAIFSSTNVWLSDLSLEVSEAREGSSIYASGVHGNLRIERVNIRESKGNITGAMHFLDVKNVFVSSSTFDQVYSSDGSGGGIFLILSSATIENVTVTNSKSSVQGGFINAVSCPKLHLRNIRSQWTFSPYGGFLASEATQNLTLDNLVITKSQAAYDGGVFYVIDSLLFKGHNLHLVEGTAQTGMLNYMSFSSKDKISFENITCEGCNSKLVSCIRYESPSNLTIKNLTAKKGEGIVLQAEFFYSFTIILSDIKIFGMKSESTLLSFVNANLSFTQFTLDQSSAKISLIQVKNSLQGSISNGKFVNCGKEGSSDKGLFILESKLKINSVSLLSDAFNKLEILCAKKSEVIATNLQINSGNANENSGIISCIQSILTLNSLSCTNSTGPCLLLQRCEMVGNSLLFEKNRANIPDSSADLFSFDASNAHFNGWKSIDSNNTSIYFRRGNRLIMENSEILRKSDMNMRGMLLLNLGFLSIKGTNLTNLNSPEGGAARVINTKQTENIIEVSKSRCTYSSGLIGTCFMLSGKHNSTFNENLFSNNIARAHSKNLESGVGASVMEICPGFSNNCSFQAKENSFSDNFAAKLAPNIISTSSVNEFANNSYENNSEAIRVNVGSYQGPLAVRPISGKDYVEIASGQQSDLKFGFMDKKGNMISVVSTSIANLVPAGEDVTLENSLTNLQGNGTLIFSKFKMKYPPGKNATLKMTMSIIMPEIFLTTSPVFYTTSFNFVSRRCIMGEIFFLQECKSCTLGTFSLLDNPMDKPAADQVCKRCPENSNCIQKYILPNKGYWKYADNSTLMLKCIREHYCLGGLPVSKITSNNLTKNDSEAIKHGQCHKGHFGNLCNMCDVGYGKMNPDSYCEPCTDQLMLSIVRTVFIMLGVITYIVVMSKIFADKKRKTAFVSFLVKLMINHFQVLSIITFNQLGLDVSFLKMGLEFANVLNFRIDYFSSDCILAEMGSSSRELKIAKVGASLLLPVVLSLIVLVTWLLIAFCLGRFRKSRNNPSFVYQKRILISAVVSIYLFYPIIIGTCFSLLNCIEIDAEKGLWVLYTEPELYCWKEPHSGYLLEAALPGILIWGVSFPIFLYFVLKRQRLYLIQLGAYLKQLPSLEKKLEKKKNKSAKLAIKSGSSKSRPKPFDSPTENDDFSKPVCKQGKLVPLNNPPFSNPQGFPEISLSNEESSNAKPNIRYAHVSGKEKMDLTGTESKFSQEKPPPKEKESKSDGEGESPLMDGKPKAHQMYEEELFSFFYDGFKLETIYWESTVLLKKFILTFFASLTQLMTPTARNTMIMLILFFFLSATLKLQPYKWKVCNHLEYLSLTVLLITVFSAVMNFMLKELTIKVFFSMLVMLSNLTFLICLVAVIAKNIDIKKKISVFTNKGKKKLGNGNGNKGEGKSMAKTV